MNQAVAQRAITWLSTTLMNPFPAAWLANRTRPTSLFCRFKSPPTASGAPQSSPQSAADHPSAAPHRSSPPPPTPPCAQSTPHNYANAQIAASFSAPVPPLPPQPASQLKTQTTRPAASPPPPL